MMSGKTPSRSISEPTRVFIVEYFLVLLRLLCYANTPFAVNILTLEKLNINSSDLLLLMFDSSIKSLANGFYLIF